MATTELIERCMEEIATTVLDAGDAISYRTLGASSQVNVDVSRDALRKFVQENESSVGAIQVVVQQGVVDTGSSTHKSSSSPVDPRARVIRIGSFSPEQSAEKVISKQIYSVYKKSAQAEDSADDAVEPISIACWSQERSMRNDIFQKVAKQAPLSRAIKSFYESGIKCVEATTRTGFGDSQGEESISIFDSMKASSKPASSSAFGSSAKSNNSSSSIPSAASNGSKSFFKSTSSATSTSKPRATSSASSSTKTTPAPAKQPVTKKIDAKSMSNVFTIDSDDDDDGSDADAPVFVKKSQSGATAKPRSKRVISDDEDEDDDNDDFTKPISNVKATKTPVAQSKTSKASSSNNNSSSRSAKRKLNASPDEKNHVALSDSDEPKRSKRAKSIENDDEDATMVEAAAAAEEEVEPVEVLTKRRVETTKTRINEQGYMVTEKIVEEVELTAEEIEQEKLKAAKMKKQQQAAKAVAEAAKAAAEKKAAAAAKSGGAPAKQKNLFSFFQRK